MRNLLQFLKDLFIDGHKLLGALGPALSIGFTAAKAFNLPVGLQRISYAWALMPLLLWVLAAYWRRWSRSYMLEEQISDEARQQADRISGWMVGSTNEGTPQTKLVLQNASDLLVYNLIASVVTAEGEPIRGSQYRNYIGRLPPGKSEYPIKYPGAGMHKHFSIELAFEDSSGKKWVRTGNGVLRSIASDPLTHYGATIKALVKSKGRSQ